MDIGVLPLLVVYGTLPDGEYIVRFGDTLVDGRFGSGAIEVTLPGGSGVLQVSGLPLEELDHIASVADRDPEEAVNLLADTWLYAQIMGCDYGEEHYAD